MGNTLSRRKSFGRFPRSVEIITQRPVIGSLRNSGNAFPPDKYSLDALCQHPRLGMYCTASCGGGQLRTGRVHGRGLRASLCSRTTGGIPGVLSMARTSNHTGHFSPWRSRRKACAARTSTWCFSLPMLNSGNATFPFVTARVRTSTMPASRRQIPQGRVRLSPAPARNSSR